MRNTILVILAILLFALAAQPGATAYNNGDLDCSGELDIVDLTYIVEYFFQGGSTPCDISIPQPYNLQLGFSVVGDTQSVWITAGNRTSLTIAPLSVADSGRLLLLVTGELEAAWDTVGGGWCYLILDTIPKTGNDATGLAVDTFYVNPPALLKIGLAYEFPILPGSLHVYTDLLYQSDDGLLVQSIHTSATLLPVQ